MWITFGFFLEILNEKMMNTSRNWNTALSDTIFSSCFDALSRSILQEREVLHPYIKNTKL